MKQRKEAFWTITDKDNVNLERYIRKQIKVCIEEAKLMRVPPSIVRALSVRIFEKLSQELYEDLCNGDYDTDIKELMTK
jgi:hypothetical protein